MKVSDDTGQARDAALLAPAVDVPVRVDTAMKAAAHEYTGPALDWWRKVALLAARH